MKEACQPVTMYIKVQDPECCIFSIHSDNHFESLNPENAVQKPEAKVGRATQPDDEETAETPMCPQHGQQMVLSEGTGSSSLSSASWSSLFCKVLGQPPSFNRLHLSLTWTSIYTSSYSFYITEYL